MYQTIQGYQDTNRFQNNLNALAHWANRWGMAFNIKKSKIIAFNTKDETPEYTMDGAVLEHVSNTKYLGFIIQDNLRFDQHIQKKLQDARKQLELVNRALF